MALGSIIKVVFVAFVVGILASFGVASAEIYMIQFGGFDNSYWTGGSGRSSATALCNPGDKIIAGGVGLDGPSIDTSPILLSHPVFDLGPNNDQDGWFGEIDNFRDIVLVSAHCLSPLSMAVGGFAIQPDTTALILAYGIMNSYWMLPTAVGIGLGIYLVKRKF